VDIKHCISTFKILGYFICFILWAPVWGQEKPHAVKLNPLLERLYHSESNYIETTVNNSFQQFFKPSQDFAKSYTHQLLKDGQSLYIFAGGTGLLYRADTLKGDSLYFKRLDKTHFYGYNGEAAYFAYRDTVYNFAGAGFWTANGHLRYYSPFNREWNIKLLNKELRVRAIFHFLDRNNGILHYTGDQRNYAEKNSVADFIVAELNLNTQENRLKGKLNPLLKEKILNTEMPIFRVPLPELGGMMILLSLEYQYLMDFKHERLLRLTNKSVADFFWGNSAGMMPQNCFMENDSVFYTYGRDSSMQLYGMKITRQDFEAAGEPLFIKETPWKNIGFALLGCLALCSLVYMLLIGKKQKEGNHPYSKKIPVEPLDDASVDPLHFIDEELTLINAIHESTLQKRYFAVDDINIHMGIKRKTLEVQKKIRTEIISRINHKFRVHSEGENDLIERVRSEQDRRYFKYMIRTENMEQLKAIIQQQGGRP
jgi:hypothetical protein